MIFRISNEKNANSMVARASALLFGVAALSVSAWGEPLPTINVALGNRSVYSMAGVASGDYSQSTTPGAAAPLFYSGSTWNDTDGASNLLDSNGNSTSVGFFLSNWGADVSDHGGTGILNLLGAEIHADAGYPMGLAPTKFRPSLSPD